MILLCISKYFNMDAKNALQDLKEIRSLMDRSTRFVSLSGLSGVLAGLYALAGAIVGYFILKNTHGRDYVNNADYLLSTSWKNNAALQMTVAAATVLVLAAVTAFFLTRCKAAKHNQKVWTSQSIRLVVNFMMVLGIGAIFIQALLQQGRFALVAPSMLIFYGLACLHASKYTLGTVKYLGLSCAVLGLINMQFLDYGLYFWAAGFGLCHIFYGSIMYFKYDRT